MTPLVQVIGFGPAAVGLPLAAARLGLLDLLAAQGIAFVERAPGPAAASAGRFPFVVESNSPAGDFIAGVDGAARFRAVMDRPAGRKLHEHGTREVPLTLVGEFLVDVTDEVGAWLRDGAGEVHYGREVHRIVCHADGTFTSVDADGRAVLRSRAVVLATGAREDGTGSGLPADRLVLSGELLAGNTGRVERALGAGGPVAILGGSHSGFSAAELLLARCGAMVRPGQITVVHRTITLGFDSVAALAAAGPFPAGVPLGPPVVCAATGRVNRFSGLRGPARRLCTEILAGTEDRVRLRAAGSAAAARDLRDATLVVFAGGYRAVAPELVGVGGRTVPLVRCRGGIPVDDRGMVQTGYGWIPGLHGIGLGFARSDRAGERQAALNVFHGRDAEDVVRQLLHGFRQPS
jgi:hypothetical protein